MEKLVLSMVMGWLRRGSEEAVCVFMCVRVRAREIKGAREAGGADGREMEYGVPSCVCVYLRMRVCVCVCVCVCV